VATKDVADLLSALRAGGMSLEEVAEQFRHPAWPSSRHPDDPTLPVPGSLDDVTFAYDRGELTREQYRTLAHAVADSASVAAFGDILIDPHEIPRRANALTDQLAARLPARALAGLRLMADAGEYGEIATELTATLVKTGTVISAAEQQELRALLMSTHQPFHAAEQLTVR
jgi:hypothetical protein